MATSTLGSLLGKIFLGEDYEKIRAGVLEFGSLPPEQQSLRIKAATGKIKVDTSQVPKYQGGELRAPDAARILTPAEPIIQIQQKIKEIGSHPFLSAFQAGMEYGLPAITGTKIPEPKPKIPEFDEESYLEEIGNIIEGDLRSMGYEPPPTPIKDFLKAGVRKLAEKQIEGATQVMEFGEKVAKGAESRGFGTTAKVVRGITGVIGTPATLLGEVGINLSEDRPIEALKNLGFAAGSITPGGAVFNAVLAQPEIQEVAGPVFEGLESIKQKVIKNLGVEDQNLKDLINGGVDVLTFWLLHRTAKGIFKKTVDVKLPTGETIKVPVDRGFWANFKTNMESDLKQFMKSPKQYFQERQFGLSTREVGGGKPGLPEIPPKIPKGLQPLAKAQEKLTVPAAAEIPEVAKVKPTKEPSAIERGFITSVKNIKPEIGSKISGQYVPRSTDKLAIKAKNLIKDNLEVAEKVAKGTDDVAIATTVELLKHYDEQAKLTKDVATKNAIYQVAADLANEKAHQLTELGRSIQAASILGRLTPEGQLKFAAREIQKYNEGIEKSGGGLLGLKKKIPELTPEQTQRILTEMKSIKEMPEGTEKAMRFQKLQNYISDLVPSPLMQKLITVWKAGLLTGIKTSGVNIFANLSHAATEIIKDIPTTIVDKIISLGTGKRTAAITLKGLPQGIEEGLKKGWRYLTTGFDERNIGAKLDYRRVNFGKGKLAKALQTYTEAVFRILGAEDQPFYYTAKLRSLYEQAKVEAINKGLKGEKAQKFIDELIQNPTDNMIKLATFDAETAVFQNKTQLGQAAKGIQKAFGGAGEIVVPFGRTPSAVAMQIFNYTPVGIVTALFKNIGKGKFNQRNFSKAMGRGLTGTAVLALGALLAKKNLITGAYPTTEKEKKLWELEGKKPNSIKIGGKWRQVQVLGPVGNVLLIGGIFQKEFENSGSPTEAMANALATSTKSFSQQTFLTGVSNFIDAVSDPKRSAKYVIGSTLASTVPTLVSDIAKAIDDKERRAEKILDHFQARIPGLREWLEPQITVLGEEKTMGNPLEVMIDPTRPSSIKDSPVIRELRRLWDEGYKVSPTLLGDKKGYTSLTPQENTALWKKAGEIINEKVGNLIISPQYQDLADDQKAKLIDEFVDKSKTNARVSSVIELTQNLRGDDLRNKLSQFKESGLMTRSVFGQYEKMIPLENMLSEKAPSITQQEYVETRGTAQLIKDYIKAFKTDPGNAWKAFFGKEKLEVVKGDLVELQRFYGIAFDAKGGSQEYKKKEMEEQGIPWSEQNDYALEHVLPRAAGGGNDKKNLIIVDKITHDLYTPIDILMGKAVEDGLIKRKKAKELAVALKVDKTMTIEEVISSLK